MEVQAVYIPGMGWVMFLTVTPTSSQVLFQLLPVTCPSQASTLLAVRFLLLSPIGHWSWPSLAGPGFLIFQGLCDILGPFEALKTV